MSRRILATLVATLALCVVAPIALADGAFATEGHFRVSHGEPLNDLHATPGSMLTRSRATVCRSGYASSVRDVSQSEKNQVYAEYGILHHSTGQYEIDHLISLELGGSNSIVNLWPELNDHPHGYLNSKDILENRLHSLVCAGALALSSAQSQIASNWVVTYHKYLGSWPTGGSSTSPPTTTVASGPSTPPSGSGVTITHLIASVAPGDGESLTIHSRKAKDSCTLAVTLPSGRRSVSAGLGATITDAHGNATWTWEVGTRTGGGTAHVTVSCSAGTAFGTFVVS